MKTISLKENTTEMLALLSAFQSFVFIMVLCFHEIPKENEQLVNIMGGAIILNTIASVYGYYFGQSKRRDIIPETGTATTITQKSTTEEIKP